MTVKAVARRGVNRVLGAIGLELVRKVDGPVGYFVPMKETVAAAEEAGLSVGEYLDTKNARPGATRETIGQMRALGVFDSPVDRVVEIGAGSGRYVEATIEACRPRAYEIYEPAKDWAAWLVERYGVIRQPCDGRTLAATGDASADVVQAHKVFVYLPVLVSCRYMREMARVARPGGWLVFDLITEDCMDPETVEDWLATESIYPVMIPRSSAIDLLAWYGAEFQGSFPVSMSAGRTECLVFRREDSTRG